MAPVSVSWDQGWQVETHDAEQTQRLATYLAGALGPGAVVALVGDLGAGKTTFVQGFAAAMGVDNLGSVLSPTYTLVNEYPAGNLTLVHMDFYRLQHPQAAQALGLDEYFDQPSSIILVEWADMLMEMLPEHTLWVRLQSCSATTRLCTVVGPSQPPKWRP